MAWLRFRLPGTAKLLFAYLRHVLRFWQWYLRIGLALIILNTLAAPTHRLYPDSQQTVETLKPQVCVHTALINEVDEWKIQQSLQLVREMGATTIVEFFPWAYLEPSRGQYHWRQADMIIRHAQNQGLRIIARIGLVPLWARPKDTSLNYMADESLDDFARFVATFAARYAGTVDHILIWNEPNLVFEWGYQEVHPEEYVKMLQAVYESIHRANPEAIVLAGALAPTLEPPGSLYGLNDLLYLEQMYEAGAADYFDALAVHSYGLKDPPDAMPDPALLNFRRAELIYDIMERYDSQEKPVYITESGWNDNPRWAYGVRPAQRIVYTLDAFSWAEANWPWLENLCIWEFREPHPSYSYRDNFTLVASDFQPKAIYYAIQDYARGWESGAPLWLPAPGS